jgi:hypothetical protein
MTELQVCSLTEVTFGQYVKLFWVRGFNGDGGTVPPNHILEITSITLNFFPDGAVTVGRADIAGGDAPHVGTGTAVWRFQVLYVQPKETLHLTFTKPLCLEAGGHVELGFVDDGPGKIFADVNGVLVSP